MAADVPDHSSDNLGSLEEAIEMVRLVLILLITGRGINKNWLVNCLVLLDEGVGSIFRLQ